MADRKRNYKLDNLCSAVRASRRALEYWRATRRKFVREYVGLHYSEDGARREVPVNLISLYCRIIPPKLIAKNPRVLLSTFEFAAKRTVAAMQTWANDQIERLYLAETMQRVVYDALFSIGICKVGLLTPAESAMYYDRPVGSACAEVVSLDDWCFDRHARDLRQVKFEGHRVRVPLEAVKQSRLYNKDRKELVASSDPGYNAEGDERLKQLSQGWKGEVETEEFEEMVDLWEIYLPRQQKIITLADSQICGHPRASKEPLREQKWIGPPCGPYHHLGLGVVPDNPMPKAPVQDQYGLHMAVNNLYRKLIQQGHRQKTIGLVRGGMNEQGERILKTNDGEVTPVDDPQSFVEVAMGGPNQGIFLLGQHFRDVFDYQANNLSLMGGLKPQSRTASQDEMLNANSGMTVADMALTSTAFFADVVESLCWFWHHDPFTVIKAPYSLPGLPQIGVVRKVTPQQRQKVPWDMLRVKIDPYSMAYKPPQQQAQELMGIVKECLPLLPLMQQQGITLDLNALFSRLARLYDMPDLQEVISIVEPGTMMGGGGEGGGAGTFATMPASTERTYTRRSLGGEGPQEQGADLMNTLARGMGGSDNGNGQLSTSGYAGG